ncbi:MAG: nuclear transport factor 2 family protein [Solirubrobacterales bacterium]|nr:nuclear transport factor 2 family protein [Solirubrobacterales bacterium]
MEGVAMESSNRGELLEAFTAAWGAKDLEALMSLMADDCAFRASVGPGPGTTFEGRAEVRRGFSLFLGAGGSAPEPVTEVDEPLISDRFALVRWKATYPQEQGPSVVVVACDIFEFEGDRITLKDTYRKVAGELPAG